MNAFSMLLRRVAVPAAAFLLAGSLATPLSALQAVPAQVEVAFPSGDLQLRGFIWKPDGAGPFPVLLWNHGSEKLPGWLPDLAPTLVRRGWIFFIPHRRGQGRSPGPYIGDQLQQAPAGGAQSWEGSPDLQRRLIAAVRAAVVPIFFIQAQNDYDLRPSQILSQEMQRAGKPHRVKIYPAFGTSRQDGHEFCVRGADTWSADVFEFLAAHVR